ncbi:hypothetical protein LZ554_005943 [Drepanopeziza brunnea f. sp. 'monogermtubi']|nr:hypothetical protein LZ554_005943 [Drepanopeziza brunnea f. sp. 'monogermtubi']
MLTNFLGSWLLLSLAGSYRPTQLPSGAITRDDMPPQCVQCPSCASSRCDLAITGPIPSLRRNAATALPHSPIWSVRREVI